MRDQYAGDISDLLKFALLRTLAGNDRTLGVAWYYVDKNDGRNDGRHIEWQENGRWQNFDAPLHAGLTSLTERSVIALENAMIWPAKTKFHRKPLPHHLKRKAWAEEMSRQLSDADLVFLDPDNSVGKKSIRHASFEEVRLLRKTSRAIVFIKFPGHNAKHDKQMSEFHARLKAETGATKTITLKTCILMPQPRIRWFTMIDYDGPLLERLNQFKDRLATHTNVKSELFQTE